MNPVVLICTHERQDITTRNINSLLAQSVVPNIVLVASEKREINYYRNTYNQINIVQHPNLPLGEKWQCGVNVAHKMDADVLIITGSDDILGPGYIEDACKAVKKGYDFIGLKRFWVHQNEHAFLVEYLADQPIGGGRVYSKRMLENISYKVFATGQSRRLDDQGFNLVKGSGLGYLVTNDDKFLQLHAIKGNWPMMNPFNKFHKNIRVLKTVPSESILHDTKRNTVQ